MKTTKIVIIGAGIAGITCAIYLKRANKDFILLDGNMPGGKLVNLHKIENYPGYSSISGPELALSLAKQLKDNDINLEYGLVQSIRKENQKFIITTDIENIEATYVVIGTGTSPKISGIPGEKEFFGKGVSYCATCDGNFFKGEDVCVFGNSNVAFEEALYLSSLVNKLYLITGHKDFDEDNSLFIKLKSLDNVEVIKDDIIKINGDENVKSIVLRNNQEIFLKGVFPYLGFKSATDFLSTLGIKMDKGYIITDMKMHTNVDNIFAIGDVRKKELRQLVTAASDGAIASLEIVRLMNK
ncbi:MAG: FAD-dependent oxidoreductase [Bacillales bacterium]|nr:FAD-dependent oxidoreductase [Bacillales bacterium]MDY6003344.1 FAD-dependent oxidoreductase [Bacilli bacterium]